MSSPRNTAAPEPVSQLTLNAFNAHSRELQRFLLRRVGNRHDADDLSQEVFARLMRIENAELINCPLAFILGIATHVVQEFRQRKQYQRVVFDSAMADTLSDNGTLSQRCSSDQCELRNLLDYALIKLPPTHQAILLLVKRDGLSYEEAAAVTGLSVHTIEKYLVAARARLRLILERSSD